MTAIINVPSNVLTALAEGRKESARQSLQNLLKEEPSNTLAWLCLAVSQPREQAILTVRRLLMLEPDNEIALRSLKRLSENCRPGFSLDLQDVLPEVESEAENVAVFGQEQPTMNGNMLADLAQFGEEMPTMPEAFRSLFQMSGIVQTVSQLPPLEPAPAPLKAVVPPVQPQVAPVRIAQAPLVAPRPAPILPPPPPTLRRVTVEPPPLQWVGPSKAPPTKAKLPAGALSAKIAARRRHSTAGAADSGSMLDPILALRPPRPNFQTTNSPWLGFAASGIFAAMLVIAVLFSLYWFLG